MEKFRSVIRHKHPGSAQHRCRRYLLCCRRFQFRQHRNLSRLKRRLHLREQCCRQTRRLCPSFRLYLRPEQQTRLRRHDNARQRIRQRLFSSCSHPRVVRSCSRGALCLWDEQQRRRQHRSSSRTAAGRLLLWRRRREQHGSGQPSGSAETSRPRHVFFCYVSGWRKTGGR
jgi:hypothetical protein